MSSTEVSRSIRDLAQFFVDESNTIEERENKIIDQALEILRKRIQNNGEVLSAPSRVKRYLYAKVAQLEYEVFGVLILDNRHRVITISEMFRGTIDGAAVYPREVVKEVLKYNGAAVILYHNHPSGIAEPSRSDRNITDQLRDALALVDIKILDHFVIGSEPEDIVSFAECGWV